MRIVLAGTISGRGGIQTHFFWLSRALLDAGHEVTVLSLGESVEPNHQSRLNSSISEGRIRCEFPYRTHRGLRNSTVSAGAEIRRLLRALRPDVYLACGTGWNLFLPAIFSSACRRRVFHEVMSGEATSYRDTRWAVRYGFHDVVAQASPVARNFKRTFRWPKEIPVLPAFPEPLEITAQLPGTSRSRVPMGLARAALFSRLVPHKQALWLVRQWPALASCIAELHVYGTGPEEALIRKLITEQGWQNRVYCHGPYPEGRAYVDLLSTFDLTLLPTIGAEGAPLVLLESMACGVPFVAFDAGGIPDYANPDCCIVPMRCPESFIPGVASMAERLANGGINHQRLQMFYRHQFSFSRLKQRWNSFLDPRHTA